MHYWIISNTQSMSYQIISNTQSMPYQIISNTQSMPYQIISNKQKRAGTKQHTGVYQPSKNFRGCAIGYSSETHLKLKSREISFANNILFSYRTRRDTTVL